jgi:hypothetical protein
LLDDEALAASIGVVMFGLPGAGVLVFLPSSYGNDSLLMRNSAALLLILATSALADGPPMMSGEMERIHDFASVSLSEALRLHGRRALFRIKLNEESDSEAGRIVYDCVGIDGTDRTVWFISGYEVVDDREEMIVEATLRIVHTEPWTAPDGMRFEAFTGYWLEDARRCR